MADSVDPRGIWERLFRWRPHTAEESVDHILEEWLQDLDRTRPTPRFWESDLVVPAARLAMAVPPSRPDDVWRRDGVKLWLGALRSATGRASATPPAYLTPDDLNPEDMAAALPFVTPDVVEAIAADKTFDELLTVVESVSVARWQAVIAMDEFCRWATWKGLFDEDPFAMARDRVRRFPKQRAASKSYHDGPAFDTAYQIDLALSGGGHRATLYSLGTVMAVVAARRVPWRISSVSGGSITNAFLASHHWSKTQRTYSRDGRTEQAISAEEARSWERATRLLFDTVVERGVLTRRWMFLLGSALIAPPVLFLVAAFAGWLPSPLVALAAAGAMAAVVLLRGLLVESLIAKHYFDSSRSRPTSWDLYSGVEHIICATDLVSGKPVYVSSNGTLVLGGQSDQSTYRGQWVLGLPVPKLVRASAGFPGIPPRRLVLGGGVRRFATATTEAKTVFLSDGGIWNNLATQAFEDNLAPKAWVVLVADASATAQATGSWRYAIPGVAELAALYRQFAVQNTNTVAPRREAYIEAVRREMVFPGDARFKAMRLCLVSSCSETVGDIVDRCREDLSGRFKDAYEPVTEAPDVESSDPPYFMTGWKDRRDAVEAKLAALPSDIAYQRLHRMGTRIVPLTDRGDPLADYPTNLDKVDRDKALGLVARGYANTAVTLYLAGLIDELPTATGWLLRETERLLKQR